MAELPTGTVTFLFTDIEGSTELLGALGERYPDVLARHHHLLRETVTGHDGVEVMTAGDAFFVVFPNPVAAVRAVVDAQRALHAGPWPDGADFRVRMGLLTGEAAVSGDNYVGLDVHRAARIASAAHGGQVLISDSTRALAEQSLPEGVAVRDLGRHRLKGLPAPERIFQLTIDGLPSDFPPVHTLEGRQHNLPSALTSFVGREPQIADIVERLRSARLLTLTGPGGTGKTRLGIRVAEEVLGDHEDGCWYVALDALRDPELVPWAIAEVLRVKLPPDQPAMSALESSVADKQLLLLLDNFEQVRDAGPHVGRLLDAAPRLSVMVTSRVPLGLYGEQEYPVPPLSSGAELRSAGGAGADALSQYESVQLFIERALAVKPDFRVTNANAPAVAEICARLDGLPLAIELAAARIKVLTPEQILVRLEQSLSLLASTAQNLPARQRTLRGAIDYSYDLLEEAEQRLFARLSVFRGGFSLESAERVVGDEALGVDVLDGVASLVNKSLLRPDQQTSEARFAMLATIREYAAQRLAESREATDLLRRHAAHFFELATAAEEHLMGAEQIAWLERLDRDRDNLRAAMERAPDLGMLDEALQAAGAVWRFWQIRAHFAEGRQILERLLAQPGASPGARAKALTGAGGIAYWQTDYEAVARHYPEARSLYEQMDDPGRLAEALHNEAYVPMLLRNIPASRPLLDRAMALYRQVGNRTGAIEAEWFLGFTYFMEGEVDAALPVLTRAVDAYRAAGSKWSLADSLIGLTNVQAALGQWPAAMASVRESLALFRDLRNELGQALLFESVGNYAAWLGDAERAARLLGASDRMKEQVGGGAPSRLFVSDAYRHKARRELGAETFDRLATEGAQLTLDEVAKLAETFDPPPDAPAVARLTRSDRGDDT